MSSRRTACPILIIEARDANGQPVASLALRLEIMFEGQLFDFGTVSPKSLVTDNGGRAQATYTAPLPFADPIDLVDIVTIRVIPIDGNYANTLTRQVDIRLVPPGTVLPINQLPQPFFTFSEPTEVGTPITFDARLSFDPDGTIVAYDWDFGDGTLGSGPVVIKTYDRSDTYNVTLTVTDDRGTAVAVFTPVFVSSVAAPNAIISFSPTTPDPGETVFFSAEQSTGSIVEYLWNFGDGTIGTGETVEHVYDAPGTYAVTLTVTDEIGQQDTDTEDVPVAQDSAPTASIAFSPESPAVQQTVFYTGEASRPASGREIVEYRWEFGDGDSATGIRVEHAYAAAASYTVALTVTDDAGSQGTTTTTVTVAAGTGGVFASFTSSPTDPDTTTAVFFDASASSSPNGIKKYTWTFGDGSSKETNTGPTTTHTFTTAGTYVVRLLIVDGAGLEASTTNNVIVE